MTSTFYEGRLCLSCFSISSILGLQLFGNSEYFELTSDLLHKLLCCAICYCAGICVLLHPFFKRESHSIATRSVILGFVFAMGILIVLRSPSRFKPIGIHTIAMMTFFCGEFLAIAYSNPEALSIDSFLINYNHYVWMSHILMLAEYLVEIHYFPGMKVVYQVWIIGALLAIFGDVYRKTAIVTAGVNFNHVVQSEKQETHNLITHGVFSIMRHPSYVGFYCFVIGTQTYLANPICLVLFSILIWQFLNRRIKSEEILLCKNYGPQYREYQRKVPTGVPFIKGYVQE